ncbi:MAG: beta-propeller domain-containing protein [Pseudomonadota bacterium]|nr:beta-propeller domain-containing protein [Pseudomonadota bacterium]
MKRSLSAFFSSLFLLTAAATPAFALAPSPFLIAFAGDDWDSHDEDFVVVFDLATGKPLSSTPIGHKKSMPHHFEYEMPPAGLHLFANAHHAEETLLLDVSDPKRIRIANRLKPPAPYRFTHDYKRLPNGNMLVGFLRSEGESPESGDDTLPGGHGGIAELTATGKLVRSSSAAADGLPHPVRPYSFLPLPQLDRLVTTSATMMEKSSADVVQIWRLSDLHLLHTLPVPGGKRSDGTELKEAASSTFAARLMHDNSVLVSSYGCAFYRLTGAGGSAPKVDLVRTISADAKPGDRGSCGVPVLLGHWWLLPIGKEKRLATFDVSDPTSPREVASLSIPDFAPHWLASDPKSDRLVLGAEAGGEEGMYLLRIDLSNGRTRFDDRIAGSKGRAGYLDFDRESWPHGKTGKAWAHAALFLPADR